MTMINLRDCPACDSDVLANGKLVNYHRPAWAACCGSCGLSGPVGDDEAHAAERWNDMPRRSARDAALAAARALLERVDFDNNGITIGGVRTGGNGSLISIETTKAADALRLVLDVERR